MWKKERNMLNFAEICIERPIGTNGNNRVINLLNDSFSALDYKVSELPFDCTVWESNNSFIEQNNKKMEIFPSPFSEELKGDFPVKYVSSLIELESINNFDGILVFKDDLTKTALMPKDFSFYFPNEDKIMYEIIEKINPKGIMAISGQDPASGLNPFPIFEDANLEIPTAYVSSLEGIVETNEISIEINSKRHNEKSKQIIFKKEGLSKDIVLIVAHMDSKYFTNGAIDNASGLYTLYEIAKSIKNSKYNHSIEIVPFNGEDSPEVSGQLAYLNYLEENNLKIKSVINIDGVGYTGSENMFSFYNFDENMKSEIIANNDILEGEQWYSGDHGIFVFQEIPCIAITASNMFTDLVKITHTKNDKIELIDINLLKNLSNKVENIIKILDKI
jgi:aminopeptidase YwaD